jgi:hypothetical protein
MTSGLKNHLKKIFEKGGEIYFFIMTQHLSRAVNQAMFKTVKE